MDELWYSLSNLQPEPDGKISANAVVPAGSQWLSGHFPGDPIVPGIAQLSIAFDIIKRHYYNNINDLKILSLKKIRFKSIVRPEELLNIVIGSAENPAGTFSFKINTGENLACSGFITVQENFSQQARSVQ